MQDPNEDTEWNAILRNHGILPRKEKDITEEEIIGLCNSVVEERTKSGKKLEDKNLDELDELEDEEDEAILLQFRNKRIAELKALAEKCKFGDVVEISGQDYVQEVTKAGKGIWVVLHLYKQGIPLCSLLNQFLSELSSKFRATKFLKSISTTCIPNYPDTNLPSIFVYCEGEMKHQFVGPLAFRNDLTVEDLEWMLGQVGAIETDIVEDPRPAVKDVLFSQLKYNV